VLAICILLGVVYRASMTLFFLGFTYVFLLDKAQYLNHFYLISLISLLLIFFPAHRALSLDAWLRPALRSHTALAWTLWMLRAQLAIVYFYGGIAKLNGDWLNGEPMRLWLAERTDFPLIGGLFTEEWLVYLFSYGGLLFDLLFVPLVLWRRTRLLALAGGVGFHLMNSLLFNIGIFPWFMIAANLLFLPPDWLRRLFGKCLPEATPPEKLPVWQRQHSLLLAALGIYFAVQLLMPLRHFLYPGDVSWTEEGHRFSWHMRLRAKTGTARYYVTDPVTDTSWEVPLHDYLTERQIEQMVTQPDMLLQFSHYIAGVLRQEGLPDIEVRVRALVSLNGRTPRLLVDSEVDLAALPHSLLPAAWIMPLDEPLFPD
jgi:vitamin K-dependent gamma-carboxylase